VSRKQSYFGELPQHPTRREIDNELATKRQSESESQPAPTAADSFLSRTPATNADRLRCDLADLRTKDPENYGYRSARALQGLKRATDGKPKKALT
jgi:hypothetical protein